MFKKLC